MRKLFPICLLLFLCVFLSARENANIILVIDHSKSMDSNFEELKTYILNEIIPLFQKGDYLFFIRFAGASDVLYADEIKGEESIKEIRDIINAGTPDYSYTDIGLALETMFNAFLSVHEKINQKSILFFITDGKNEPPPESKFYTEEYTHQQKFFELAEYRKTHPWKVMVLNIGDSPDARDLSRILDGEHILITSALTSKILSEKIGDFLGHLELILNTNIGGFGLFGKDIPYRIESTYSNNRDITITGIEIGQIQKKADKTFIDIDTVIKAQNKFPLAITVTPVRGVKGRFHIDLPGNLKDGTYKAELVFLTSETGMLLNRSFEVTFNKSFPVLVIIIIAIVVILLIAGTIWFLFDRGIL
jgi:hypothetical protein